MTKYYSNPLRIISFITLIAFVFTQVAFGYPECRDLSGKSSGGRTLSKSPQKSQLRVQQSVGNSVGSDLANSIGASPPQRDITVDIVDTNSQEAENRTIIAFPIKTLVLKLISGFFMTIFPSAAVWFTLLRVKNYESRVHFAYSIFDNVSPMISIINNGYLNDVLGVLSVGSVLYMLNYFGLPYRLYKFLYYLGLVWDIPGNLINIKNMQLRWSKIIIISWTAILIVNEMVSHMYDVVMAPVLGRPVTSSPDAIDLLVYSSTALAVNFTINRFYKGPDADRSAASSGEASAGAIGNTARGIVNKVFAIRPEGLSKAHRSYGKGLMAYQVIERAEHNGISFREMANSFMHGADSLFAQWKKWQIIEDSEIQLLGDDAKEDLLSGVWYLVAKEANYPYRRNGTRFWEGTVVKLQHAKEVIINGLVHGVYLLRGNYRDIRGILENEPGTLTLFEQNLSELYRVEGAVEMDDHEMIRIVEMRVKQDAREMKRQKQKKSPSVDFDSICYRVIPFMLLFVGGFFLYCVYPHADKPPVLLGLENFSDDLKTAGWLAVISGAVMIPFIPGFFPFVKKVLKFLERLTWPLLRHIIEPVVKAFFWIIHRIFEGLKKIMIIGNDALTATYLITSTLRHRYFTGLPKDPRQKAHLVAQECFTSAMLLTPGDDSAKTFYRISLPMPVNNDLSDVLKTEETRLGGLNRRQRYRLKDFVILVLRSAYMAEWAHQAVSSGSRKTVRLVVGQAHEEQIAYYIIHPQERKSILLKYLGEDNYHKVIAAIQDRLKDIPAGVENQPLIDIAQEKKFILREKIEICMGILTIIAFPMLLSIHPVLTFAAGIISVALFYGVLIWLVAAAAAYKIYRTNADAIRKTAIAMTRAGIIATIAMSVFTILGIVFGLSLAQSVFIGAGVVSVLGGLVHFYEHHKRQFDAEQTAALTEEAEWFSNTMHSLNVSISGEELLNKTASMRTLSNVMAFFSVANIRSYVLYWAFFLGIAALGFSSIAGFICFVFSGWLETALLSIAGLTFVGIIATGLENVRYDRDHNTVEKIMFELAYAGAMAFLLAAFGAIIISPFKGPALIAAFKAIILSLAGSAKFSLFLKIVPISLAVFTLVIYMLVNYKERGFYDRGLNKVMLNPNLDKQVLRMNAAYYWTQFVAEREGWRTLGKDDRDLKGEKLSQVIALLRARQMGVGLYDARDAVHNGVGQKVVRFVKEKTQMDIPTSLSIVDEDGSMIKAADEIIKRYNGDFERIWKEIPLWFDEMIVREEHNKEVVTETVTGFEAESGTVSSAGAGAANMVGNTDTTKVVAAGIVMTAATLATRENAIEKAVETAEQIQQRQLEDSINALAVVVMATMSHKKALAVYSDNTGRREAILMLLNSGFKSTNIDKHQISADLTEEQLNSILQTPGYDVVLIRAADRYILSGPGVEPQKFDPSQKSTLRDKIVEACM